MLEFSINIPAVVVAAIATMIIGSLWYGPIFGKPWAKMMGFDMEDKAAMEEMKKKAKPAYFWTFLGSIVLAIFLSAFGSTLGIAGMGEGLLLGFFAWLGFVATTMLANYLFSQREFKLYLIDSLYHLLNFLVMSAIVTVWV